MGTTNIRAYLKFLPSRNNFAWSVGKAIGINSIELRSDASQRAVVHGLSHAIGLTHEHQSPKRDEYVRINTFNIAEKAGQFEIRINDVFELPYDFESITHYSAYTGSKKAGLKTIEIIDEETNDFYDVMGLGEEFSEGDLKAINKMYA